MGEKREMVRSTPNEKAQCYFKEASGSACLRVHHKLDESSHPTFLKLDFLYSNGSLTVDHDPLWVVIPLGGGVTYQISHISCIYIMWHNTNKISVMKQQ